MLVVLDEVVDGHRKELVVLVQRHLSLRKEVELGLNSVGLLADF